MERLLHVPVASFRLWATSVLLDNSIKQMLKVYSELKSVSLCDNTNIYIVGVRTLICSKWGNKLCFVPQWWRSPWVSKTIHNVQKRNSRDGIYELLIFLQSWSSRLALRYSDLPRPKALWRHLNTMLHWWWIALKQWSFLWLSRISQTGK